MSKDAWYVMLEDSEQGPFNPPDIKNLVDQGYIVPDTLIRRGDMATMVPAAKVKGLFATPVSPTQQQFNQQIAAQQHVPDNAEQDAIAESPPRSSTQPKRVTTSRYRKSAQQSNAADDDDLQPSNDEGSSLAACSFGSRVASHLIDVFFISLIFVPVILINTVLIIGMFVADAQTNIDEKRQRLSGTFQIPSYEAYVESGEYKRGLPPEPPGTLPAGPDDESEADRIARHNAHVEAKNTYAEKKYLRELYEKDTQELEDALKKGVGVGLIVYLVMIIILALYPAIFEAMFGGTIGKLICKQVVVYRKNGRRVGFGAALLRQLLRVIPFGQLRALANDRLTVHDLLSGTVVIPKDQYAPQNKYTNRHSRTTSRVRKTGRVRRK